MGNSDEWRQTTYQQTFDDETRGLERRRQSDSGCKIEDLEGTLKNLYIMEGADMDGRGSLQDAILSARIAAYEEFIDRWKTQQKL